MKKLILLVGSVLAAMSLYGQTVTSPTSDLGFTLKDVIRTNASLKLEFVITNNTDTEKVINLVGGQYQTGMSGSIAYDDQGNIYELNQVLVSAGNKSYTEQYSGVAIPGGVGVKCHLWIDGVQPDANEIAKVKICILCPELSISNTGVCFEINHISLAQNQPAQ